MEWYYFLAIGAFLFSIIAQGMVRSRFTKFSAVPARSGYTGFQAARRILDESGLSAVRIEHVQGQLSDHFSPKEGVLRLSDSTCNSPSIAAIGVALHEVGHALQQRDRYPLNAFRSSLVPVANIGSMFGPYLAIIGLLMAGSVGSFLLTAGVILFGVAVLFYFVTLPVEFNASLRALSLVAQSGILSQDEIPGARKVLSAAAMTYVAAASSALINLLRLVMIASSRRRR